ncbi:apelin receptor-like [Bombina bombina]|uniref:apelin receptor-like n=1 Tax=Bombina bombina TaxID=8345 RepID=UPI00235AD590|nr:apelin receptor-like [Bombina bombina]
MENETDNLTILLGISDCDYNEWEPSVGLIPATYILIFFVGITGNGLVLWASHQRRDRPRSADSFILQLALADLAFVVTLPLWAVYASIGYHWPFGTFACKLSGYLVLLNMYASAFCLTGLSLDRYIVIVLSPGPGHSRSSLYRPLATVATWASAGLLALPALIFRSTGQPDEPWDNRTVCFMDYSSVASSGNTHLWEAALGFSSTLLAFLAPFCVILFCYVGIGRRISGHFRLPLVAHRKRRLLAIMIGLVVTFGACWFPFHLVKSVYVLMNAEVLPLSCALHVFLNNLHPYVTCLGYANSCLNPVLYAFLDPRFRSHCQRLLGCGGKLGNPAGQGEKDDQRAVGGSSSIGGGDEGGKGLKVSTEEEELANKD